MGDTSQSLTVTGSFGGGWDSDVLAAFRGSGVTEGVPSGRSGGTVGFGSGAANYSIGRGRFGLGASAATSAFVYNQDGTQVLRSYTGGATQNLELSSRTRLTASEFASYQPYRLDRLFPGIDTSIGAPEVPASDSLISSDSYVNWGGTLGLSQQLTQRVSLSASYGRESSERSGEDRLTAQHGSGSLSFAATRGLSIRLGYGYGQASYGGGEESRLVRNHTIDAGVDYSRSLSFSRRTTLSFGTGSTAIRERHQTHFRLTGQATLNRQIGRSWNATVGYVRGVQYLEQLREVVFSDGVNGSFGGLVTRRLSFHTNAGVSTGDVGFGSGRNGAFATYARVGLVTAVNRFVAVGADYNFYRHSFGADVSLPDGILHKIDRHGVRAYISLWAPLIASTRSFDASR
jgi:hypothetical protein